MDYIMAVNNEIGRIIAQYAIGNSPAIYFCEDDKRYHITTYADEIVYQKIMDESAMCGLQVYRDDIDSFIISLHHNDEFFLQNASRIYKDSEILAGERIKLFFNGAEIDLLKIRSRYYICTYGPIKGKIVTIESDYFCFDYEGVNYNTQSMAFLVPCNAFTIIDHRYLKIYRSKVTRDISDIYNEVNSAIIHSELETEFGKLLEMCSGAGISLWTLMGIIDHIMLTLIEDE